MIDYQQKITENNGSLISEPVSMKLNLKTTIIFSSLLAVMLNLLQFFSSLQQRKDAFAPTWAYTTLTPSPVPATRATTISSAPPTNPSPTPNTIAPTAAPLVADPVIKATQALQQAGLNATHAGLYLAAQQSTGTPWQLLAAVHKIESGQSGSTSTASYAGAVGPMQFLPSTFRAYSLDGDGDGVRNITDLEDAVFSAGRYLAANGASRGQYATALYRYNHSYSYVSTVTNIARRLGL